MPRSAPWSPPRCTDAALSTADHVDHPRTAEWPIAGIDVGDIGQKSQIPALYVLLHPAARDHRLAGLGMARPAELLLRVQEVPEVDGRLGVAVELHRGREERVDGGVGGRHPGVRVGADGEREGPHVHRVQGGLDRRVLLARHLAHWSGPPITPYTSMSRFFASASSRSSK